MNLFSTFQVLNHNKSWTFSSFQDALFMYCCLTPYSDLNDTIEHPNMKVKHFGNKSIDQKIGFDLKVY